MKNIDTRSRRHEEVFHTMSIKQKRVLKTTNKKKEDNEILYCHYCDKRYHHDDFCWKKLKDLSLKDKLSRNKPINQDNDNKNN